MVSGGDDADAVAERSRSAVEVVAIEVHELRPHRAEPANRGRPSGEPGDAWSGRRSTGELLEVRPIGVHEVGGPIGLVAAPARSEQVVVGTSALRLVRPEKEAAPVVEEVEDEAAPVVEEAEAEAAATAGAVGLAEIGAPPPAPARAVTTAPPAPVVPAAPAELVEERGGWTADLLERPRARRRERTGRFAPGLRRRWWAVVLLTIAGLGGGFVATKGAKPGYSAQVLLEVRAGSAPGSPGGAVEASYLAITYAALVPSDTAVVEAIARRSGLSGSTVASGLSAKAESGTGLFLVTFSAPSPLQAVSGANEAGAVLSSAAPPGLAIVRRSIAVVRPATTAARGKNKRLYGLVGGGMGGALLGLILLLVLERVDARVDEPEDATATAGVPSARWPGGMSVRELAVALARRSPDAPVSLVPLTPSVRDAAERLARLLAGTWSETGAPTPPPTVTPYDEAPAALSDGSGPTVVVVAEGGAVRTLAETTARLRLLERPPTFVIVCGKG